MSKPANPSPPEAGTVVFFRLTSGRLTTAHVVSAADLNAGMGGTPVPAPGPGRLHLLVDLDPAVDSASGTTAIRLGVAEGTGLGAWRRDCPADAAEQFAQLEARRAAVGAHNQTVKNHAQRAPLPAWEE